MKFFKTLIAATLGTLLAVFLISIVLFITIISSSREPEPYIRENTILKINLEGTIPAHATKDPIDELLDRKKSTVSLESLKENLDKARVHSKIKGVFLDINFVTTGWADLQEAHRLISAFRDSSDKFVYANTNDLGYNEQGYYLATAADSIFSPPESFFEFDGFVSQITYYTGLFEKLGIQAEVTRHGKYKSAVEPYFRKELSEESEYQLKQLLNTVSSTFVEAAGKKTGRSVTEINNLMNQTPTLEVRFADQNGLIDSLLYRDQFEAHIKKRIGLEEDQSIHFVSHDRYGKVSGQTAGLESGRTDGTIGVIYASGEILPDLGPGFPLDDQPVITVPFFEEQLDKINENSDIKALVIRINSPGGSGSTSDAIWRMIRETKKEMPVIVSMGPVAASGGYYISMAADSIVAEPTTITGSIGVFATKFNAKQLFNEELGITFDEVKSHEHADWLYPTRSFSAAEEKAFQNMVDGFYETFIGKVAEARGMTPEQVDEIAQGRVWAGADAKNQNLVDQLGGMDTALSIAAEKSGMETYDIVTYPKEKNLWEVLMGNTQTTIRKLTGTGGLGNEHLDKISRQYRRMKQYGALAILPYEIKIK